MRSALVALAALAVALAACSSSDGGGAATTVASATTEPAPTTTKPAPTTTPATTAPATTAPATTEPAGEDIVDAFAERDITLTDDEVACLFDEGLDAIDVDALFDQDGELPVDVAEILDGCVDVDARRAITTAVVQNGDDTDVAQCFSDGFVQYVVDNGFVSLAGEVPDGLLDQIYADACADELGGPGQPANTLVAGVAAAIEQQLDIEFPSDVAACVNDRLNAIDAFFDLEDFSNVDDPANLQLFQNRAYLEVGLTPFACHAPVTDPFDLLSQSPGATDEFRDRLADIGTTDADAQADLLAEAAMAIAAGPEPDETSCVAGYMSSRLLDESANELLERVLGLDASDPATSDLFVTTYNCTSGQEGWEPGQPAVGDIVYPAA